MSKGKLVAVCLIWLCLAAVGAGLWRLVVTPLRNHARQEEEKQSQQDALLATQGDLPYDHEVTIALDSFSGYAVLRSDRFAQILRRKKIKLNLVDDGANYTSRLAGIQSGSFQMAAFTIDALVKTSSQLGQTPATIVALLDETRGADAIVASKKTFSNVDDLNDDQVQFVVTPESPSETLVRVVMSTFALDSLGDDPFVRATDVDDVFDRYRRSTKNSREVFVLWEPYVSKILANDSMHVVIDSSQFRGFIVDCLVADRDFLVKQPEIAQAVVESYFRALYEYRDAAKMKHLVIDDAGDAAPIDADAATKLVDGIHWKNTQENLAHFGLRSASSMQHIADMIDNITDVLVDTGAIENDPTAGQPNRLYFDKILRQLADDNFHPGGGREQVVADQQLPELSDDQWESLVPVGTLAVSDLVFPRGADVLTGSSQLILDDLVKQLEMWPRYYVIVRGNASRRGDLEANKKLARARAVAAQNYLVDRGVPRQRIRAVGVDPSGATKVNFVLGQLPY